MGLFDFLDPKKLLPMLALGALTAATGGLAAPAVAAAEGAGAVGAGLGAGAEGIAALSPEIASAGLNDVLSAGEVASGGLTEGPSMANGAFLSQGEQPIGPLQESGEFFSRAPMPESKSPLDWDWKGATDKAQSFIKLAKSAQDFSSLMKGEPNPNQRLNQAAPPQQQSGGPVTPQAAPSAAIGASNLPSPNLVSPTPQENPMEMLQRLRMMRGY